MDTAQSRTGKILLIQTSESGLVALRAVLDKNGFQHCDAVTVRDGVHLLDRDSSIDLVIMPLPSKDPAAMEMFRYVRRTPRTRFLPVIMTCTQADLTVIQEIAKIGHASILAAPFTEQSIVAKISGGLENGKRVVLVIDDEQFILQLLTDFLEMERFKVLTATDAENGLEIIRSRTIHAVISDITLPNMSGLDLLSTIKKDHAELPVILMTGNGGKLRPQDLANAGADGYFTKPFKNVEMALTLHKALGRPAARKQV